MHKINLIANFTNKKENLSKLTKTKKKLCVVGRVINKRVFKNHFFVDIIDGSYEKLQIMVKKRFPRSKVGSIIKVKGCLSLSPRGYPTIICSYLRVLNTAKKGFPHTGRPTQNKEYYTRLFSKDFYKLVKFRSKLLSKCREFLSAKGFLEIETPILSKYRGTSKAKPFVTKSAHSGKEYFLRISAELSHKKLAAALMIDTFEIGKVFRNMGPSKDHIQEYTVLEIFKMFAKYTFLMDMLEELFDYLGKDTLLSPYFAKLGKIKRVSMRNFAYKNILDSEGNLDRKKVEKTLQKYSVTVKDVKREFGELTESSLVSFLFQKCFKKQTEDPIFFYEFPAKYSPLSCKIEGTSYSQEFEFVYKKSGIAHGYTANISLEEQKKHFETQLDELKRLGIKGKLDREYIEALRIGLPPLSSVCVGIDRLVLSLLDLENIRNAVILPVGF